MFSQYEILLKRGFFDIPELNIETSSLKAVFAQIIMKYYDRRKGNRRWNVTAAEEEKQFKSFSKYLNWLTLS